MGRHRRSAAAPVANDYADGSAGRHRGGARRKKRGLVPVRTGLLGASAAMAVGAVAVTTGLLPGGDKFNVGHGNDSAKQVRTEDSAKLQTQGDASAEPTNEASAPVRQGAQRPHAPSKAPSPKTPPPAPAKPSAAPAKKAKVPEARKESKSDAPARKATRAPSRPAAPAKPAKPAKPAVPSDAKAAEAEVLSLVNAERAKVGCSPVQASESLAALAGDFSDDMATRGFFGHTDPEGATPWDRAAQVGVQGLGGENIARGQADPAAVMTSWMNSDGHRANILNCDYKTMGVGVHLGAGGPWWTQDFGF
ncbi:CAP domain-containing protein [Streptomyces sp. NPDC005279]|uniref:CAP domain-containing protein n=1 Tax=Streptomyces sp. NPDC005279 TaxID=3364712 RepID=UPI0036A00D1C